MARFSANSKTNSTNGPNLACQLLKVASLFFLTSTSRVLIWNKIFFYHKGRGVFNYNFGIVPFRKPTYTVIGKPIDVKRVAEPSQEQIDQLHDLYVKSLVELFDEHKQKYSNGKDIKLEIIS